MKVWLLFLVAILNLMSSPSWAQIRSECPDEPEAQGSALKDYLGQLKGTLSAKEMDSVIDLIVRERREAALLLDEILRTSNSDDLKIRACYLLGVFRSEFYVGSVVDNIALKAPLPSELTARPRWTEYPCEEALERIGRPAERNLLLALGETDSVERRRLLVGALLKISGPERAGVLLREAEKGVQSDAARLRLREAQTAVEDQEQRKQGVKDLKP